MLGGVGQQTPDLQKEVTDLRALVLKLQARIDDLERKVGTAPAASAAAAAPSGAGAAAPAGNAATAASLPTGNSDSGWPWGTSFNMMFDGYYGYNFNAPIGRVNLLRAYDVSSNSFSINQAAIVWRTRPIPATENTGA
jgi:hypothetical protein